MRKQNWHPDDINALFDLPFLDLLFKAQTVHRQHFDQNEIERCTLLSIKTGACPEDCAYCPQSGHYETGTATEKLLDMNQVIQKARLAKEQGATRFCMGAAWRSPPKKGMPAVLAMVKAVKELGLESCVTLGTLDKAQAEALKEAGLDFYNHNLDTSPEFYPHIISTRSYQDRLDTLAHLREAGIKVCCGGIVGMGESRQDRVNFLAQLANLPKPPESVPINRLVPVPGTPLEHAMPIAPLEWARTIAVARTIMPTTVIRLAAGRAGLSDEMHALCFLAGANSIFYGDVLLTAGNAETSQDDQLFKAMGLTAKGRPAEHQCT